MSAGRSRAAATRSSCDELVAEEHRRRVAAAQPGEVVPQAGQLGPTVHLAGGDGRAEAPRRRSRPWATSSWMARRTVGRDRLRRSAEGDLVLEGVARLQLARS